MRRFLRENGLSIALFGLFLVFLGAQSVTGFQVYNDDAASHGEPPIGYLAYLGSAHFVEAVFENWESEFLQMAAFVLLTIALKQKGSSESKPLEDKSENKPKPGKNSPWPVRQGGWIEKVYENSLTIALALLFVISFGLHALGGAGQENRERARHGEQPVGTLEYVGTSQFWFESFQNWQSEFLAVAVLVGASVYLREKGSPESKPVAEPHYETGA